MDDGPAAIAPPGGPISAPVRSLWQTDTIGLVENCSSPDNRPEAARASASWYS
jgi:hypothetical protein